MKPPFRSQTTKQRTHTRARAHTHTHTQTHKFTHTHMHMHTRTHTHVKKRYETYGEAALHGPASIKLLVALVLEHCLPKRHLALGCLCGNCHVVLQEGQCQV